SDSSHSLKLSIYHSMYRATLQYAHCRIIRKLLGTLETQVQPFHDAFEHPFAVHSHVQQSSCPLMPMSCRSLHKQHAIDHRLWPYPKSKVTLQHALKILLPALLALLDSHVWLPYTATQLRSLPK